MIIRIAVLLVLMVLVSMATYGFLGQVYDLGSSAGLEIGMKQQYLSDRMAVLFCLDDPSIPPCLLENFNKE